MRYSLWNLKSTSIWFCPGDYTLSVWILRWDTYQISLAVGNFLGVFPTAVFKQSNQMRIYLMSWRVWEKRLPIISSFFKITFFLSCKNSAKVLFQKILYCPKFTYFNYTGPARVRGNVKNMTWFLERAIMGWINETNLWIHIRENVLIRVL